MATDYNSRISTYGYRWWHQVYSTNKVIRIHTDEDVSLWDIPERDDYYWGMDLVGSDEVPETLEYAIYNAIENVIDNDYGLTPADVNLEVSINADGHLEIQYEPSAPYDDGNYWISVYGDFSGATIGGGIIGTDGGLPINISGAPGSSPGVSPRTVGAIWTPNMFYQRDTGDTPTYPGSSVTTNNGIPVPLLWGEKFYKRVINYETISAARIHRHRGADELYSVAAGMYSGGDENAALENLIDYVYAQVGPYPGRVELTQVIGPGGVKIGRYYVDLEMSKIAKGVTDENLYEESSQERFSLELHLRKDET